MKLNNQERTDPFEIKQRGSLKVWKPFYELVMETRGLTTTLCTKANLEEIPRDEFVILKASLLGLKEYSRIIYQESLTWFMHNFKFHTKDLLYLEEIVGDVLILSQEKHDKAMQQVTLNSYSSYGTILNDTHYVTFDTKISTLSNMIPKEYKNDLINHLKYN